MRIYYKDELEKKELEKISRNINNMDIEFIDIYQSQHSQEAKMAMSNGLNATPLVCTIVDGEEKCALGEEYIKKIAKVEKENNLRLEQLKQNQKNPIKS